ncbi:MAG: aromatic ring-hydroxylating dioxygenase subunit alpha [Mogibacterium sp.]|nr:aromatic ring-hydroxylating dioxygenase subunit alpha [Mogibacterium sp.]
MINNQWYAVLSSHKVRRGRVIGARRFGENMVFFRDDAGVLGCVTDKCAHRGASLAKGCMKDGNLQCPFHGIEYDMNGKCVHIPSEGRASVKDYSRFDLKHWAVQEVGGIVFLWYGDSEPAGEPDVFDIVTDSSYTYDHTEDSWGVDYSRVIENQLDVSHLPFVHRTTIGRGGKTLVNGPKTVWLDDNTMQTSANNEVDTGQTPLSGKDSIIKTTNLNFKFPNMWLNHVSDKIQILAFFIPVDDDNSIIALRFYTKLTGKKSIDKCIAWFGSRANKVVERQDKRIVITQLPKKTGLKMGENLVPADKPIIEYRSKRDKLQK